MRTLMSISRPFPVMFLFGACFLGGLGCSNGTERVVAVTGRVTHKDKPVAGIVVSFVPQTATNAGTSIGTTDEDGQYELTVSKTGERGAVVGTHKVWVSLPRKPEASRKPEDGKRKKNTPANPATSLPADTAEILKKYGKLDKTPLTVEVKGDQTLDLKLD
jgi:hypothetical protein